MSVEDRTDSFVEWDNFRSVSDVMLELFADQKMDPLGGPSGRGWSYYSQIQRCPRMFQLNQISNSAVKVSESLDVGVALHLFLALYYKMMMLGERKEDPEFNWWRDQFIERNCNPHSIYEAWRLYEAYRSYYIVDYLVPLAVELKATDSKTGFTCRYDLIARAVNPPDGVLPGVYVVDHKSTKFDFASLDSWDLDGELLGEVAIYNRAGLNQTFGRLQGLLVNIVGKQKVPKFYRTFIAPTSMQTEQHMKDLKLWSIQESRYRREDYFPRALAGCIGRYGICQHYDTCRNEP